MARPLIIDVSKNLPPRAHALTGAELESVFGGNCGSVGRLCKEKRDCCTGTCYGFHAGYRMGTCMP